MKQTKYLMGMPITVDIVEKSAQLTDLDAIFDYFRQVDQRFSTYLPDSEISQINQGLISPDQYSPQMRQIFKLAAATKQQTNGYFDIGTPGNYDPSGIVKGWAIQNAAMLLKLRGFQNFYVEAGGDIQTAGLNHHAKPWRVGIRHPFSTDKIVKTIQLQDQGVATSGTYFRGQHITDPHRQTPVKTPILSLTVIGPNIYTADLLATAAFAMGPSGLLYVENQPGFEGYQIDHHGVATFTSGFASFVANPS